MTLNLSSLGSATFWTAIAGAASLVCGAVHAGNLAQPVETVLVAVGGLLVAIVGHHTTKAAVAKKAGTPVAPVAAP
jgi:membrane protease YdiL (CAAX protease family)